MRGLVNIGNTCFMNASLQMLFNNSDIKYISENTEIAKIIQEYNDSDRYNPIKIKNIVAKYNPVFKGLNQQDSSEFIVYFFEALINDNKDICVSRDSEMVSEASRTNCRSRICVSCYSKTVFEYSRTRREPVYSKTVRPFLNSDAHIYNLVYNLFGVDTTISIKCRRCDNISSHVEPDLLLNLPLNNFNNLNDLYRNYKESELLCGDNIYHCDKCKMNCVAKKKTITSRWKDNIIIVLKRFDNRMRKNESKIDIPLNWRHGYELQGGIIHMGSFSGGHYIYYGKEGNNWFLANDSSISKINNIDEFMQTSGKDSYIVLYRKKNTNTL